VLLVEDLHWADDSSLDLLQHLMSHAAELPLALVMTAGPRCCTRRPDWGTPQTPLPLSPLAAAQSDAGAAKALLQRCWTPGAAEADRTHRRPRRRQPLLHGRAGAPAHRRRRHRRIGEPHWTVQTDRLDTLRLPSTLVGLLQARLDALPASERQAARQASVIGHVFWDDALQALDAQAPQALPALQRAAFVKRPRRSDFEGTPERQFDHHLLHQVTYDTLLKAERKLGHGAAARWLAARTQGRGAEFLAMTGEHAERAGETALAIDCFEQAGQDAQTRFANAIAQSYFRRALALLGEADPGRSFDLLSKVATVADVLGDRATQDATHAERAALLERHPDDTRRAELLFSRALLADRRGEATASEPLALQSFELAERCGAARFAAMAQGQLAWLHVARQDYAGATLHIEIGLPWAARIEGDKLRAETEAQLLTLSGMVAMQLSRLDEARRTLMAVLSRGEALGKPRLQLGALDNLAVIANTLGQWNDTAAWGERILALADSIGSAQDVAGARLRLAEAAEARGDTAAALRWHERGLVIHRATANRRMEAITQRFLAGLNLTQGDATTALQCGVESQTLHLDLNEPLEACLAAAIAAQCQFHLGQPAAALERLDAVLVRVRGEMAEYPANETIGLRWRCHQLLHALGDERATPMLEQLHADVQATAAQSTDAADRERLIKAIPDFRDIVAAYGQRGAAP
jgi:tetratricopeptide (TPR) repeat protein